MSTGTGYRWEGIRQVRATLLGARHVGLPERLCDDDDDDDDDDNELT